MVKEVFTYYHPTEKKEKGETFLYVMRINCQERIFKDTSINGFPNFKAQWQSANNDLLIDMVIEKSCSERS